jgi:ribosomal-protein-alanine N-acetyltransferase
MASASSAASIRFATRADALGIAEMSRDFIEQGLGWSWTRERILRSLRNRDSNAIVAVREADRAGFAIM